MLCELEAIRSHSLLHTGIHSGKIVMPDLTESFQLALLSLDRLAASKCVAQATDRLSAINIVDQIVVSARDVLSILEPIES